MKTALLILAAGATFAAHMPVQAETGGSLYESRLGVIKGTAPGIVVIGAGRSSPAAAASSASGAAAATQTTAQKAGAPAPAASAVSLAERAGAVLKWGDPPSGQALNSAKRLDSPTQGIVLPSAGSAASQPAK